MRWLPLLLALAACPAPSTDTCDAIDAELASLQSCTDWQDCGQPLTGLSCGCTRAPVARLDADPTALYALLAQQTCEVGTSTCDCPEAHGFDCVDSVCVWDYAQGEALPSCRADRGVAYDVTGLALNADALTVSVAYGGGCATHTFTLCWPDQAFAESDPVQASLELFHEGVDPCDAWLTEDVVVDLMPLRQAWTAAYGGASGTIVVHLGGQRVDYTF